MGSEDWYTEINPTLSNSWSAWFAEFLCCHERK